MFVAGWSHFDDIEARLEWEKYLDAPKLIISVQGMSVSFWVLRSLSQPLWALARYEDP